MKSSVRYLEKLKNTNKTDRIKSVEKLGNKLFNVPTFISFILEEYNIFKFND